MHQSRRPAVLRGFAAASVAIFVALAGHMTAGGEMPGMLGILVPWVLSAMACVLLAGRRLSLFRLALSVVISQFLFHVLFVLGTITPSGVAGTHVHGGPLVLPAGPALPDAATADGLMWFGHAVAAVLTIAALHRGERLLLTLRNLAQQSVRWMRRRVDAALVGPRPAAPASPPVRSHIVVLRDAAPLSPLLGRAPPTAFVL